MRRLISTKRVVGEDQLGTYDSAWVRVVRAAGGVPGRVNAWRFRASSDPLTFVEFLEFPGEADPRRGTALEELLRALDSIAPATSEEWEDAPAPATSESNA